MSEIAAMVKVLRFVGYAVVPQGELDAWRAEITAAEAEIAQLRAELATARVGDQVRAGAIWCAEGILNDPDLSYEEAHEKAIVELRKGMQPSGDELGIALGENDWLRALIPQAYIRGVNDYAYGNIVLTDDLYHRAAAWLAEQETK